MRFPAIVNFIEDRRGSTAVEFALVAMIFLTFVFGLFEVGYLYWTWNAMQYGVEKTTRYVMTHGSLTDDEIMDYARNNMPGLNITDNNPEVFVDYESASGVNFITVSTIYEHTPFSILSPEGMFAITLRAKSRMAQE